MAIHAECFRALIPPFHVQGEGKDLVIEVGNVVLGRVIRITSKQVRHLTRLRQGCSQAG